MNKNTIASRAFRADAEKRRREEKSRLCRKIENGIKPRLSTLKQYDISVEEVNARRKAKGLSPLDYQSQCYNTTAIIQTINQQTEERIEELEKQKTLATQAKEDKAELNKAQKDIKEKFKNKIVNVPDEDLYNVKTINQWMYLNGTDKQGEGTRKLQWGKPENNFRGNFVRLMERSECDLNDIRECLKKPKQLIDNYGNVSEQTRARVLNSLSQVLEFYPAFDIEKEWKGVWEEIKTLNQKQKTEAQAEAITRRQDETLRFTFSEMKEKVCKHFGDDSKECLYMKFYEEVPSRDDLGNIKVYRRTPENQPSGNYLILTNRKATFVLQEYKTKGIYGKIETILSKSLREALLKQDLSKPLFTKGKSSQWVKNMLLKSGAKLIDDKGNITLLRKAFVSEKLKTKLIAKERVELAQSMKHSPLATLGYVRKFKEETDKNIGELDSIDYNEDET